MFMPVSKNQSPSTPIEQRHLLVISPQLHHKASRTSLSASQGACAKGSATASTTGSRCEIAKATTHASHTLNKVNLTWS